MPCPHSGVSSSSSVSRRDFVRVAVSIGGASALSACLSRSGDQAEGGDLPDLPRGDPEAVPNRQHSWSRYILSDEHGNPKFPEYQSFLFLDYASEGVPTEDDRETVETALGTLEEAYIWGAGEDAAREFFHDGILFTMSYSPSYFERFDESLPSEVDLRPPEDILQTIGQDPSKADSYDAVLHLAADYPEVLLATELALFGERPEINGIEMGAHLGEVFEKRDRRGGFVGQGLPAEHLSEERVSEEASASMGFKSSLLDNVPSEDSVTISEGSFAGATVNHVSKLVIDLDSWYDRDDEERIDRMYSPHHSLDEVGPTGEGLANDSEVTEELAEQAAEDVAERGVAGHAQKVARARDDEFDPVMLRRGDFNAEHPDGSVLHFGSLQRSSADLIRTLESMYDLTDGADESESGILSFVDTEARGTYLMPPRRLRALPPARPE